MPLGSGRKATATVPLAGRHGGRYAVRRAAAQDAVIKAVTFRQAAVDYIALHVATWRSGGHTRRVIEMSAAESFRSRCACLDGV